MISRRDFLELAARAGTALAAGALAGCTDSLTLPLLPPANRSVGGPPRLDVRDFGARGDGLTDDTAAIQRAIDTAPAGAVMVVIPDGVYLIDALRSVVLRDDLTLELSAGATLRAIPNAAVRYAILLARDSKNLVVRGGTLQGERYEHRGTSGEWGMGVHLLGCTNVRLEGVTARDCWGDGFYLGHSTRSNVAGGECANVEILGCTALDNRRQGLSITGCVGARIEGCTFARTNGTPPQSGIDLEPNGVKRVENITVRGCRCTDNAGWGILLVNATAQHNTVVGNRCERNRLDGIRITRQAAHNTVADNLVQANREHGIRLDDRAAANLVRGNECLGNGMAKYAGYDNLFVHDRAERNRIEQNRCRTRPEGSRGWTRYGLRIDGPDCVGTELAGNDLRRGGLLGGLYDAGTGTVIR